MKRRSFLSLLAAAFASPLVAQLEPLIPASSPLPGWCDRCGRVHQPFDPAYVENLYILPAIEAIREAIDARLIAEFSALYR